MPQSSLDVLKQVAAPQAPPAGAAPSASGGSSLDVLHQVASPSAAKPAAAAGGDYTFSGNFLKDVTGQSAEEWHNWNEDQKKQFLSHPITSMIKNLGSFAWGAVKGADELNPGGVQATISRFQDAKENWGVYEQSRKEGKSVVESLDAAGKASQQKNPLQIFRPPDEKSDITEHALYNSVAATNGEGAARIAVALKRTIRGLAEDFKKNPDEAAGNMSVKMLPVVLTAGAGAPEAAAAETEAGVGSAARTAGAEAETAASNLKEPSLLQKVIKPEEAAKTSAAIKGEGVIRQATGNTSLETPVRGSFGEMADNLRAEAKPIYQKMDEALEGRWDANKNAMNDVNTALRRESDIDKLAKLKARKTELLSQQKDLQAEAAQKGVSQQDIQNATNAWRRAEALDGKGGLDGLLKSSVDAQDRVSLPSLIKKLKNFDGLEDAMGGPDKARSLVSRLEDELAHQHAMQMKYKVARVAAGGAAGYIGLHALTSIIGSITH
jgi:hypothetical protein